MYVTGTGSEEYHMNRLADAMIPYLNSCGIRYVRNTPEMSAGSSIRQANQGWYNFYLALHSVLGELWFRPGHYCLLLPQEYAGTAGCTDLCQQSAGDLPGAGLGGHTEYHQLGGGPGFEGSCCAAGDRLP